VRCRGVTVIVHRDSQDERGSVLHLAVPGRRFSPGRMYFVQHRSSARTSPTCCAENNSRSGVTEVSLGTHRSSHASTLQRVALSGTAISPKLPRCGPSTPVQRRSPTTNPPRLVSFCAHRWHASPPRVPRPRGPVAAISRWSAAAPGILPITDISRLRLEHADMSTCAPAHRLAAYRGAPHLLSALQLAGFRHVVTSMWPHDDELVAAAGRDFAAYFPQSPTTTKRRQPRTASCVVCTGGSPTGSTCGPLIRSGP
jgi:hypothetical protein